MSNAVEAISWPRMGGANSLLFSEAWVKQLDGALMQAPSVHKTTAVLYQQAQLS